jgi:hypothetical protein
VPSVASFARSIGRLRAVFPPLKGLLFDAFLLLFALIEMVRFLRWLWKS